MKIKGSDQPNVQKLSIQMSFQKVSNLGSETPIVLTSKAKAGGSYRRARYRRQQQTIREGKVFKEMRKSLPGFIRFGKLGKLLQGDNSHRLNLESTEPYDFVSRGNQGIFVFHDDSRIRIVNLETGKVEDTLTHVYYKGKKMELYNVHTVQYHPMTPDLLLISITGLDRVIEVNIETREVTWEWCPWHHGMHTNEHGLTIIDKGDAAPSFPKEVEVKYIKPDEAKRRVNENILPKSNEVWIHQVELSNLPARLGLQKWERVKLINSAYYAEGGDKVMITFWQTGEAICVNRITGKTKMVAKKLGGCPHSFINVDDSYYLTDTRAGRVLKYNASLQPICEIGFTDCPLPIDAEVDSPEWLQNTHPITTDLLATIDFRRSRVVVWSFQRRIYSEYPVSNEWVLQSLKRINPSSIRMLDIQESQEQKQKALTTPSPVN